MYNLKRFVITCNSNRRFDEYALSNAVREEVYKCYPNAKLAHLKSGGNFPYLSRSAEVNLHLQVNIFITYNYN